IPAQAGIQFLKIAVGADFCSCKTGIPPSLAAGTAPTKNCFSLSLCKVFCRRQGIADLQSHHLQRIFYCPFVKGAARTARGGFPPHPNPLPQGGEGIRMTARGCLSIFIQRIFYCPLCKGGGARSARGIFPLTLTLSRKGR